jgi:hypothetical protein
MELKNIKKILASFSGEPGQKSFVYLDTCGVIDMVRACKRESSNPIDFFNRIIEEKNIRFLLTPKTSEECKIHTFVKRNNYVCILPESVFNYLKSFERNIFDEPKFISKEDKERIRYDVYWASKLACDGNKKKHDEEFGEVDKDILYAAAFTSTGKIKNLNGSFREVGLVGILSSDQHLVDGVRFMNKISGSSGSGNYSLYSINTRRK